MQSIDEPLHTLYVWTLEAEEALIELRDSFPSTMRPDYERVSMSLRCLRIGLELRLNVYPKKPDGTPHPDAALPREASDVPF